MAFNLRFFALLFALIATSSCQISVYQFRLLNFYGDNMVLQSAPKAATIAGWGLGNTTVELDFNGKHYEAPVNDDYHWSIQLDPQPVGGPHNLIFTLVDLIGRVFKIELLDVMFGDVWLCGGAYNMQFRMEEILNATEEIQRVASYSQLRIFQPSTSYGESPQYDVDVPLTKWTAPNIDDLNSFSAVCALFGANLADALGSRPVGVVDISWGETAIEAWASPDVLATCDVPPVSWGGPTANSALWNGTIYPISRAVTARGAIWSQGESNSHRNRELYECQLIELIREWRSSFLEATVPVPSENDWAFPFGIVQAGVGDEEDGVFGELRWFHTASQGHLPNAVLAESFLATTYDLTDSETFFPLFYRDKSTVATRLANAAKNLLYGETQHLTVGPEVETIDWVEPGTLTFIYSMEINVKGEDGFAYKEADGAWVKAPIIYYDLRQVHVNVPESATVVAYGWTEIVCEYKACGVYSMHSDDLPAPTSLWDLIKRPEILYSK